PWPCTRLIQLYTLSKELSRNPQNSRYPLPPTKAPVLLLKHSTSTMQPKWDRD
ncbi:hypothetical protein HYPSUDRAFT_429062, partial [Hypholoma sublateritium FD-334 SS-4]